MLCSLLPKHYWSIVTLPVEVKIETFICTNTVLSPMVMSYLLPLVLTSLLDKCDMFSYPLVQINVFQALRVFNRHHTHWPISYGTEKCVQSCIHVVNVVSAVERTSDFLLICVCSTGRSKQRTSAYISKWYQVWYFGKTKRGSSRYILGMDTRDR